MQYSAHTDGFIRPLNPVHTAVSPDAVLFPPIFIVHFLAFRLPSEWALKFVHERYPPGTGRVCWAPAGTVNKKKVILKRGDGGRNEIQTCERSSLPPVSSAGIYPHPEVCSAIKHWSSFLKFSYFRTYFLLWSCKLALPSLSSLTCKTDAISWTVTHHAIPLREVLGGCCTMRQLDLVYKNYGHVSFPWDTHVNKKHTKLNLL